MPPVFHCASWPNTVSSLREFVDRESTIQRSLVLKPQMLIPDSPTSWDLLPPVPAFNRRPPPPPPPPPVESGNRYSRFQRVSPYLTKRRMSICNDDVPCPYTKGLNDTQLIHESMIVGLREFSTTISSRQFSSS
jgi:hypothetical protein